MTIKNTSFAAFQAEDRRLCLLLALVQSTAYKSNHVLLQSFLESIGHAVSLDQVRTDLAWLEEQGLLTSETVAGVVIPTITQRGQDVARGFAHAPGVKRPAPGAVL